MMRIPNYGHVLVALSGGPDSVALALLALESGARVSAAHVEHGIRGADSVRDMEFVEDFCARQGIALYTARIAVPELAQKTGVGLETAAREARYAFLRKVKEQIGADVIATAHHRDDQMETVLMHLFRGCGTRGLEGMRARSGDLVRPLLEYSKADLIAYLRQNAPPSREAATTRRPAPPRNAFPNGAIPSILRAYPQAARAIAQLARVAQLEGAYLDAQARPLLRRELCGYSVDKSAPEALVKRAMACVIPDFGGVQAAYARRSASLPGGWQAETYGNRAYFIAPDAAPLSAAPLTASGARARGVEIVAAPCEGEISTAPMAQVFCGAALCGAVLRSRMQGDFIRPLGMVGRKKLSDYMADRKIPAPLRAFWPVVAVESEVLWVVGAGVSERSKVTASCGARVKLTARYTLEELGGIAHDL